LGFPDVARAVQDLAVQVAGIDQIVVDDADAPHAAGRRRQRRRATEAARADDEDAGVAHSKYASELK